MLYFLLFIKFFIIGALSFGGGYASLPLIQSVIVEEQGWLTVSEFADILTLSEVTPGPIALNAASFAGYRVAGISGSLAATLGCTTPSCIIVSILSVLYVKYRSGALFSKVLGTIRPAVCAMVGSSFLTIASFALFGASSGTLNVAAVLLFAGAFLLILTKKVPTVAVILFSGLCGLILL